MQLALDLKPQGKRKIYKDLIYNLLPVKRPNALKRYPLSERNRPKGNVIYFLWNSGKLVYSGRSSNLSARLRKHRFNGKKFDSFSYFRIDEKLINRFGSNRNIERSVIQTFKPELNIYYKMTCK